MVVVIESGQFAIHVRIMSVSNYQSNVLRLKKEIAALNDRIASETTIEARKAKEIESIRRSITKHTSASSLQSKIGTINRLTEDIGRVQKRKADLERQVAQKTDQLHRYEQQLS